MLTFSEIKEMITMVNESVIQHFELNHEGTKIVIDKNSFPLETGKNVESQATSALEVLPTLPAKCTEEVTQVNQPSDQQEDKLVKIISPTVGTFYSAPEPGAETFVKVGQAVNENDVVCILEAMKLFNEVNAGVKGTIVEVLFSDGDFVEYGDTLFLVRPE